MTRMKKKTSFILRKQMTSSLTVVFSIGITRAIIFEKKKQKSLSFNDIFQKLKFVVNNHINITCYKICWSTQQTKSMKIGYQQLLMTPQYI